MDRKEKWTRQSPLSKLLTQPSAMIFLDKCPMIRFKDISILIKAKLCCLKNLCFGKSYYLKHVIENKNVFEKKKKKLKNCFFEKQTCYLKQNTFFWKKYKIFLKKIFFHLWCLKIPAYKTPSA